MKGVPFLLAAAALAAPAAPSVAQDASWRIVESELAPAGCLPELAEGEMLVQVTGTGEAESPADRIVFTLMIAESRPTQAEADAAAARTLAGLTEALQAAGIPPEALTEIANGVTSGFIGGEAYPVECEGDCPEGEEALRHSPALVNWHRRLELEDVSRLDAVRAAVEAHDVIVSSMAPQLDDHRAARREAIDRAVADAREEAASYAASLGMRIVRTVRLIDRTGNSGDNPLASMLRQVMGEHDGRTVITEAQVSLEVVVAPE